ncbi:MAG: metallophosphoesterase [Promethearchaeota archaeon]
MNKQLRRNISIAVFSFLISLVLIGSFTYFVILTRIRTVYPWLISIFSIICISLGGLFIWLGIYAIQNRSSRLTVAKRVIFAFGLILMVTVPIGEYGGLAFGPVFHVDELYYWNDGPYVTFGEDPQSEMTISWLTKTTSKTEILFGTDPNNLEKLTSDVPRGHLHHYYLTDLTPDTKYYYKINKNFAANHDSDLFSFTTAPSSNEDFKVILVGDMQPTWIDTLRTGELVARGIVAVNPDFVIQLGDLASSGDMAQIWHFTMKNFPLYAANAPFQLAVGNHDYAGGGDVNTQMLFPNPYNSSQGLYYSFDYGNAHFINIDNFDAGHYEMSSTQKVWVEQDIIDAKNRGQKWIFISFHHTILTTGTSGQNWDLQSWLVPVADKYDVDGIFFGHDHHYEHWNYTYGSSGLLYNDTDTPSGNETNYWCSGGGGAHLETDYGVLTNSPRVDNRYFYNITAAEYQYVTVTRNHWNESRFVEFEEHKIYADGELYYHAPDRESYATDNEMYGYQYGEQTLHYMKLEVTNSGNTCTISAHYPNGDILMGPDGLYPQTWTFTK